MSLLYQPKLEEEAGLGTLNISLQEHSSPIKSQVPSAPILRISLSHVSHNWGPMGHLTLVHGASPLGSGTLSYCSLGMITEWDNWASMGTGLEQEH